MYKEGTPVIHYPLKSRSDLTYGTAFLDNWFAETLWICQRIRVCRTTCFLAGVGPGQFQITIVDRVDCEGNRSIRSCRNGIQARYSKRIVVW